MKRNRTHSDNLLHPLEYWFIVACLVVGILAGTVGWLCSPPAGDPPEQPAPSSLHEVARELDCYLGKPCPWSREELETLRISITNLLEQ